tara:strand:+ start:448 stop:567 length:120 start_codon:yes stop_codon:yes gene_type:complete
MVIDYIIVVIFILLGIFMGLGFFFIGFLYALLTILVDWL